MIICHAIFWYCGGKNLRGQTYCIFFFFASDEGKKKKKLQEGIQQPREEEGKLNSAKCTYEKKTHVYAHQMVYAVLQ